jgi:hypothetical protein
MDHQSTCMADEVFIFTVKNHVTLMLMGQGQPSK